MELNKSLKILFFLNSVFVFAGALLGPLYAVYIQEINKSAITVSISWAIYMISATICMYFVAKLGDKVKEKEYLLASGFLVRAMAWFGYVFVSNIAGLITVQILLGLGEALGTPSWNAIFADHLNRRKEIKEYSSWNIISNLLIAFGTVIGGVVATYFGFNVLFAIMGTLALFSFIGTLLAPRKLL